MMHRAVRPRIAHSEAVRRLLPAVSELARIVPRWQRLALHTASPPRGHAGWRVGPGRRDPTTVGRWAFPAGATQESSALPRAMEGAPADPCKEEGEDYCPKVRQGATVVRDNERGEPRRAQWRARWGVARKAEVAPGAPAIPTRVEARSRVELQTRRRPSEPDGRKCCKRRTRRASRVTRVRGRFGCFNHHIEGTGR